MLQKAAVVETVDPFQGRIFYSLETVSGATTVDDLGLEKPVDHLGQGIVVTVADAADRSLDARFGQPLCVSDRQILAVAVTVVTHAYAPAPDRAAIMHGLPRHVEGEPGMGRGADPPADDLAGISIKDER